MSADDKFEVIEVPVQKVSIDMTVDDVLAALAQHSDALATGTQHSQPQVAQQLTQLSQLAGQLRGKLR